ncbi:DUF488 domain-containing protein [Microbacterium neungamense]|uniref:DUF488 domain-containing protein n=1 Tax=Microbacterium neungamense TaxID=2810535 RepID=UPI00217D1CF5|nr:DUF488 domain-containing protein [Microbacterium neungamense]UWF78157.1 DUF488 domain-containing protein [Microbacterium neungamense]
MPFFTIGHSDHPLDEFVRLLTDAGASAVCDVRKMPGSRRNPQFGEDVLAEALPASGIRFLRLPELGGLRSRAAGVPPDVNGLWRNRSFHNYADHALSDAFRAGLQALRGLREENPAVMCAEAVWWRCHRRIVADHLLGAGEEVVHIMPDGRLDAARLTPGAAVGAGGVVTYPAA